MAEEYYASFRPAIELYGPGPEPSAAFEEASDRGLVRIDEMASGRRRAGRAGRAALGAVARGGGAGYEDSQGGAARRHLRAAPGRSRAGLCDGARRQRAAAALRSTATGHAEARRGQPGQVRLHRRRLPRAEDAADRAARQRTGRSGAGHQLRPRAALRRDSRWSPGGWHGWSRTCFSSPGPTQPPSRSSSRRSP